MSICNLSRNLIDCQHLQVSNRLHQSFSSGMIIQSPSSVRAQQAHVYSKPLDQNEYQHSLCAPTWGEERLLAIFQFPQLVQDQCRATDQIKWEQQYIHPQKLLHHRQRNSTPSLLFHSRLWDRSQHRHNQWPWWPCCNRSLISARFTEICPKDRAPSPYSILTETRNTLRYLSPLNNSVRTSRIYSFPVAQTGDPPSYGNGPGFNFCLRFWFSSSSCTNPSISSSTTLSRITAATNDAWRQVAHPCGVIFAIFVMLFKLLCNYLRARSAEEAG